MSQNPAKKINSAIQEALKCLNSLLSRDGRKQIQAGKHAFLWVWRDQVDQEGYKGLPASSMRNFEARSVALTLQHIETLESYGVYPCLAANSWSTILGPDIVTSRNPDHPNRITVESIGLPPRPDCTE